MTLPRIEHARLARSAMVCTVDHLASVAAITMLGRGGSAADAAVAASAVQAVTTQHMCGMGGDLWALVHIDGSPPRSLNAAGRAGSGITADSLRAEGHTEMPFKGNIASTSVPGCVDGWLALHEAHGRLDLGTVLAPAIDAAANGFPAAPQLAMSIPAVAGVHGNDDFFPQGTAARAGQIITRPGLARSLEAIVAAGRDGWYGGEFGEGLVRVGGGVFTEADLVESQAEWVAPVGVEAWGHKLWTVPPPSQGYLAPAAAGVLQHHDVPDDPQDPLWGHLLIEAAKQVAVDRIARLHDAADGPSLLASDDLARRAANISLDQAAALGGPATGGGTIYMCVVDSDRMAVSLMQSNASGFGTHLTIPEIGVFLHNRAAGFSLTPGHPAEFAPGRKPPSTLSPALITNAGAGDRFRTTIGAMGGDGQPQVVLQMAARLLHNRQRVGETITMPRFTLTVPEASGFNTWTRPEDLVVALEAGSGWGESLTQKGHRIEECQWGLGLFGHAHLIDADDTTLAGAADPRAWTGAAIGL